MPKLYITYYIKDIFIQVQIKVYNMCQLPK